MSISGLIAGGGGIPVGDQLRTVSSVAIIDAVTTTILTESGGTGGLFYGFYLKPTSNSISASNIIVTVTIDGASPRSLNFGDLQLSSSNPPFWISVPINYETSLTVQVYVNWSGGASTGNALGITYSLKN